MSVRGRPVFPPMTTPSTGEQDRPMNERFSVVVIGGGQTGLAAGYDLARRGVEFVILEREFRLGANWRPRWDPRRLHTPGRFDGLPGLPFHGEEGTYPTKDQMAGYLEQYVQRFGLPVRLGIDVVAVRRNACGLFVVECAHSRILADQVIVATTSTLLKAPLSHASRFSCVSSSSGLNGFCTAASARCTS
jgi:putative flavoprotein involved in K+ transport